jgi:hypothetical protein
VELPGHFALSVLGFWPQCQGKKGEPRESIFQYYYPKFTTAAKKHGQGVNGNEIIWAQNQKFKLHRDGTLFSVSDRYETRPIQPEAGSSSADTARQLLQKTIDAMPTKAAKLAAGTKESK